MNTTGFFRHLSYPLGKVVDDDEVIKEAARIQAERDKTKYELELKVRRHIFETYRHDCRNFDMDTMTSVIVEMRQWIKENL